MNRTRRTPLRIIELFDIYQNDYQQYIPEMIKALRDLDQFYIEVKAFGGRTTADSTLFPSYYLRRVLEHIYRLKYHSQKLNYCELYFLKEKIDIVHIQHSYLFPKILNLLQLPAEKRPKVIITLRGGDTYVKPWLSRKWNSFYKGEGKKIDAFVVMSENQKQYLVRWGICSEKIHVIPISFGSKFEICAKPPNSHMIKIISVFRMCWEKNITDSLRFIRFLKEKNVPIKYELYGDGPDLGHLYYLRDKYNLNDIVHIKNRVENNIIKQKLADYDFILQLSHSEAFPASVLEALSFGVPAIVSNSGGLPEIISHNENGFIVESERFDDVVEEILLVWKSKPRYEKMSAKAIEFSHQNYSIENEVEKLKSLYQVICK